MRMPDKLWIEGIIYDVLMVDNKQMNKIIGNTDPNIRNCGQTDYDLCQILINSDNDPQVQQQTLLHELIHIASDHMDMLTESQVDQIARSLNSIIIDNDLDFRNKYRNKIYKNIKKI